MKDGTFSYTLPVGESHLPEEARITVLKYMSTVVTSFCKLWSNEMHSAVSIYLQANITLVNPRHRLACDITGIIIVPLSDDDDAEEPFTLPAGDKQHLRTYQCKGLLAWHDRLTRVVLVMHHVLGT